MKNYMIRALACVAALVTANSAYAAPPPSAGHYEWHLNPRQQNGPRAPLLAPQRIWVATTAMVSQASDCTGKMATYRGQDVANCMRHCTSCRDSPLLSRIT